jgi:hypothetical protein
VVKSQLHIKALTTSWLISSLPRISGQVADEYVALVKLSVVEEKQNTRIKMSPFSFYQS